MASIFTHAVVGATIGGCLYGRRITGPVLVAGAFCSVFPDVDTLGFQAGVPYESFWGHRGFVHSLVFAALLAAVVVLIWFRKGIPAIGAFSLWTYFFLATASHGLLDAMTDGGLGVAFFAPFDNNRYFLPWTPIRVSPIGFARFFTERGWEVMKSEFVWVWIPCAIALAVAWLGYRDSSSPAPPQ